MTKVWTAGNLGGTLVKCLEDAGHFNHLDSYASTGKRSTMTDQRFSFFLDSGAFSAWSRGAEIDLDEYCEFIKANFEHLDVVVNLDCIAGRPGVLATPSEKDAAAEKSWENFLYMTEVHEIPGVVPVYHYGESIKFLDRMLSYGCKYIGLGGMVGTTKRTRQLWLDRMWEQHLTDNNGTPLVKVHGFGMTAVDHIFRYPWFSVDSTSWLQATSNGSILVPQKSNGVFVFDKTPTTVSVSKDSPNAAVDGKHIDSYPKGAIRVVEEWLAMCGKTLAEVREHYRHRGVVNVTFFRKVSEQRTEQKWKKRVPRSSSLWD